MNNTPENKKDDTDDDWEFPSKISINEALIAIKRLQINYSKMKVIAEDVIKKDEIKPESKTLVEVIKILDENIAMDIGRVLSHLDRTESPI